MFQRPSLRHGSASRRVVSIVQSLNKSSNHSFVAQLPTHCRQTISACFSLSGPGVLRTSVLFNFVRVWKSELVQRVSRSWRTRSCSQLLVTKIAREALLKGSQLVSTLRRSRARALDRPRIVSTRRSRFGFRRARGRHVRVRAMAHQSRWTWPKTACLLTSVQGAQADDDRLVAYDPSSNSSLVRLGHGSGPRAADKQGGERDRGVSGCWPSIPRADELDRLCHDRSQLSSVGNVLAATNPLE